MTRSPTAGSQGSAHSGPASAYGSTRRCVTDFAHKTKRPSSNPGQPKLRHRASGVAGQRHPLAVAVATSRKSNPRFVGARYFECADIEERIAEMRIGREHRVTERHEIDRAPDGPPAGKRAADARAFAGLSPGIITPFPSSRLLLWPLANSVPVA